MPDMTWSPLGTRLDALPLRPVVTVVRETPLDHVARVMRAHDVSAVIVGEPGEPVAIVTERDLAQALADGRPSSDPVVAVASRDPITVRHRATVLEAAAVMLREGVRHLVVTADQRVAGVVSQSDVLAALVLGLAPDTVVIRLDRLTSEPPEMWLG
jgi:CBS domain-containing protein